MATYNNEDHAEILKKVHSSQLRDDFRFLSEHRHNPFLRNGQVDVDAYIQFVTEYNAFISHRPRPFRKMTGNDFRL